MLLFLVLFHGNDENSRTMLKYGELHQLPVGTIIPRIWEMASGQKWINASCELVDVRPGLVVCARVLFVSGLESPGSESNVNDVIDRQPTQCSNHVFDISSPQRADSTESDPADYASNVLLNPARIFLT